MSSGLACVRDERFSRSPFIVFEERLVVIAVSWAGVVNESTVTELRAEVVSVAAVAAEDDEDAAGATVAGSSSVFGTLIEPS